MDSQNSAPTTSQVNCCDCGCSSCSAMNRSYSGTWLRSVKRKFDEYNEDKFIIPGFILPLNARIEIENECTALREMVSKQQHTIQDLSAELEEERNASSSAANEAMSMILRLQGEKAEVQMEFKQFKRYTEEKTAHDQQEINALEDLLYKREQTIQSLTCEVQMYKHRMMSYGLTESEAEGDRETEKGRFSRNNSMSETINGQFEVPPFDYPPLKCTINENQVYTEFDNEVVDVEKYAFEETPRSCDQLRDLEHRINQLERTPRSTDGDLFKNNILEKVIVGHSPRRNRHLRKFSTDSVGSPFITNKEINSDFISDSPRLGGSIRKVEYSQTEERSNLRKVDNSSEIGDDMSDRVYTIDSVHQGAGYNGVSELKASAGMVDDYTPRDSLNNTDFGDPEVTKLYFRLQALEADRESMRQAMIAMRTDKAQVILLKEIAQQLCKEMTPAVRKPAKKPSVIGSFSFMSVFKWITCFVLWRRKARRCKYTFGSSTNNSGLLMLLDKGSRVGQWRCLMSTQV
ncbi:myosin-binding protein 7-like [Solanum dulcamara]|uniref:myosin-binding protein 7-like n=1 Tax=Solanum dulcamara TaxID=45834 RepID=UPI002485ACB9|nr:myosin-binding protein 7-like [Solanum dulcamara]